MLLIRLPDVWHRLESLLDRLARHPENISQPITTPETRKAERDLVTEMIWNNPEAFSSNLDVEYMMSMRGHR